jgi:diguanylate cyclase (GGDEF)-like protein
MTVRTGAPRSAARLFAAFALASLVPVLVLGLLLARSIRQDADTRGLAEARSEAALIGRTAVEPLLDRRPLGNGLSSRETALLRRISLTATGRHHPIIRLRLRSLHGKVVFTSDGVGLHQRPDPGALAAAHGEPEAEITYLNADKPIDGNRGERVAEVYTPLYEGAHRIVGVLELYLPYAPIANDVDSGLGSLYRDLAVGLVALYVLFGVLSYLVTRRLRAQVAQNAYLAEHDVLTGLPNRTLFQRRADEAAAGASGDAGSAAVAVIDLDRFKEVNDTLGHGNGDVLLRELGLRLGEAVRAGDTVARLGGDEFGIVLRGVQDHEDVRLMLERLLHLIQREVEIGGLPLTAEASIGFAMAPEDGIDGETLLQHADVAMYVAKASPVAVLRYDAKHDHYDSTKLALVSELRQAIARDELVLHYQPKVAARTGQVTAVEALVRWNHPERGLLYPDAFLPIAEQTGLIESLTRWVLNAALGQLTQWDGAVDDIDVAINVSARNVVRADFADTVMSALRASGVSADRLLLEITETAFLSDPERAGRSLRRLAAAGVRISLDDFGCGHTSLGYLSTLPLHEVKIDKSFVLDMLDDRSHAAIVRSVIDLAHNLGFEVVAEGVETDQILAEVTTLGCDVAQGYVLARPMPSAALPSWLTGYREPAGATLS